MGTDAGAATCADAGAATGAGSEAGAGTGAGAGAGTSTASGAATGAGAATHSMQMWRLAAHSSMFDTILNWRPARESTAPPSALRLGWRHENVSAEDDAARNGEQ